MELVCTGGGFAYGCNKAQGYGKEVLMATLRDVAKEAGVSISTASVVVRGEPGFKPETRDRILKAADKLQYRVNLSARFLKEGSSGMIALVVPDLANPYYSDLAWNVSCEAAKQGYQITVQQTSPFADSLAGGERATLRRVSTPMCDGLIVNLHNVPENELEALIGDRPAVLLEDYEQAPRYDNVALPLEAAFRTAFQYLKQQGYRHVAIAGGQRFSDDEFGYVGRNTGAQLAMQAMIEAGLGESSDVIPCAWTVEGGNMVATTVIEADLGYDAFFCMNDLIAFGLIRGLSNMGVRVPQDKGVFGFDGVSPAFYTIPQLSTIALDFGGIAQSAVQMLAARIKEGEKSLPPRRQVARFRLVRGESA